MGTHLATVYSTGEKKQTLDIYIYCLLMCLYSPFAVHVNAYVNISACTIASKSEQAFIDKDKTSKLSLMAGEDSLHMKRSFHISTTLQQFIPSQHEVYLNNG